MNPITNLSDSPAIGAFVVNTHDDDGDHLDDAAGFISTVAKNQRVLFADLIVDEECVAEVIGDRIHFSMPAVTVVLPADKCQYPDLIAKWVADSWYTFAKACFEDLRS
jgi:hypothetical protein